MRALRLQHPFAQTVVDRCRPCDVVTNTAAAVAASIGTSVDVTAVISTTITMPVNGARTTAPKKAAIPTVAMVTVSPASTPGTKLDSPVKIDPPRARRERVRERTVRREFQRHTRAGR